MSLNQYSTEQLKDMSMLELAYEILLSKKQAISFKELLDQITAILELSEDEVKSRISQFYTDLNIDGRFLSRGENRWGLRAWYPLDQIEEEVLPAAKPKKKKAKKAEEDADDLDVEEFDEIEEEDLDYDEIDEFDDIDEDEDLDEEEEDADFEEDLDDADFEGDEEEVLEDDEYEIDEDSDDNDDDEEKF